MKLLIISSFLHHKNKEALYKMLEKLEISYDVAVSSGSEKL